MPPTTSSTPDIVNTWFAESIATGAIARNTEAYNQVLAAKDDLIARLGAATSEAAPAPDAKSARIAAAAAAVAADEAELAAAQNG